MSVLSKPSPTNKRTRPGHFSATPLANPQSRFSHTTVSRARRDRDLCESIPFNLEPAGEGTADCRSLRPRPSICVHRPLAHHGSH